MIPACPNNLLLMALVFWCAAFGATIDDTEINESSDYRDISFYDQEDFDYGDTEIVEGSGIKHTIIKSLPGLPPPILYFRGEAGFQPLPRLEFNGNVREPEEKQHIQMTNASQERTMLGPPLFPLHPPEGAGFYPGFRPLCSGSNDSYRDGSSLPCHKKSHGGGNGPFDNKMENPNVLDVKPDKKDVGVSEVARLFLTSPMSTIIIPSFYTAVCLLSVPANICALLVFLRRTKPINPAVIYMLNLASADLLFAMVLPFKIFYHFKGNDWIFGEAMCRLVTAAFYWNMYCSVLLITLISADRLLSVVYPMDSLSWRSPRKAFIACAVMWVLSFAGSMHKFFTEQTVRVTELNITSCRDIQPSQPFHCYKIYYITLCLVLFFLPLIITVVSYTRVIITLNKDQPGVPGASGRKRRAAMLTTTVLVMFFLCFTPTNIIKIIHQVMFTEEEVPQNQLNPDWLYVVYSIFLCLGSLNCGLDPLVYYFGSTQFQKEVCSMLGYKKTKQDSSSNQTSPGQSNPNNSTNQTNTKYDCEENSK